MALSAANVIQAKTGSATGVATASVALDNPCVDGSTVTIELCAGGISIMDTGYAGRVPDGFEFDGDSEALGARYLHAFRKPGVTAGEQSWDFAYAVAANWYWRVTEWDQGFEVVSPLDAFTSNFATGTGVTSLSTGTTPTNGRADTVALGWHLWQFNANDPSQSVVWSNYTNGFTERDQLRGSQGTADFASAWSWKFNTSTDAFESTASVANANPNAGDIYVAMLVVYAAAQPEIVSAPTMIVSS